MVLKFLLFFVTTISLKDFAIYMKILINILDLVKMYFNQSNKTKDSTNIYVTLNCNKNYYIESSFNDLN